MNFDVVRGGCERVGFWKREGWVSGRVWDDFGGGLEGEEDVSILVAHALDD